MAAISNIDADPGSVLSLENDWCRATIRSLLNLIVFLLIEQDNTGRDGVEDRWFYQCISGQKNIIILSE